MPSPFTHGQATLSVAPYCTTLNGSPLHGLALIQGVTMEHPDTDFQRDQTEAIWQSQQDQPYLDLQDSLHDQPDSPPTSPAQECNPIGTPQR